MNILQKVGIVGLLIVGLLVIGFRASHAQSPTFQWTQNPLADLAGYNFYCGPGTRDYDTQLAIPIPEGAEGATVTYKVEFLSDHCKFFALTAYDLGDNESGYSNEVNYDAPPDAPQSLEVQVGNLTINARQMSIIVGQN